MDQYMNRELVCEMGSIQMLPIKKENSDFVIKVSIIVPVYNGAAYIVRCLESIVNQTEKVIEIIVVDDGSEDETAILVDELAQHDKRIKVIHKTNGGLSSARNAGLRLAVGEYIMFVDGDDWLSCNAVENLYIFAQRHNADILRFMWVIEDTLRNCKYPEKPLFEGLVLFDADGIKNNLFTIVLTSSCLNSCCKNIVRNRLIKANNLKFDETQPFCEDLLFTLELLSCARSYVYVPKVFYHYYKNTSGLTGMIDEKKIMSVIKANLSIFQYLKQWGIDTSENRNLLCERKMRAITSMLVTFIRDKRVSFHERLRVAKIIINHSEAQVAIKYKEINKSKLHEEIAIGLVQRNMAFSLVCYCILLNLVCDCVQYFKREKESYISDVN